MDGSNCLFFKVNYGEGSNLDVWKRKKGIELHYNKVPS